MTPAILTVFGALDLPIIVAGHQYDFRGSPSGESGGDDGGGGIGTASIVAVLVLTLVTVGVLAWLNRRERGATEESRAGPLKMKTLVPVALTVVLIAAPLALWIASSGDDEETLIVERATGITGSPELIVYLEDDELNTLRTTHGRRTVRVECLGRQGQVVLDAKRRWPFIDDEPGFDSPHIHQAASREQLQQADRCRLRGTFVRLEADVRGTLTG
jgi:cbb3-type cytochrome oxidase subunit 3